MIREMISQATAKIKKGSINLGKYILTEAGFNHMKNKKETKTINTSIMMKVAVRFKF